MVVDVLSFTTSVSVAVESGTRVIPCARRDGNAERFAKQQGARLAVERRAVGPDSPWSLSPAALRRAPFTPSLVLPSPNGSAIAAAADGVAVVAGCLRNGDAVAEWLAERGYGTADRPVGVVAAGERWRDGSVRPALEDLLGAGAVIAALRQAGLSSLSREAEAAASAFESSGDVAEAVRESISGRELAAGGFADDVSIATELNGCAVVPVLTDGAFTASV
ncbi:2-phosphosulfolactate phosphatase [Streptomyces kaniharaensis]|uniref:2-phosphosulfolactate phosphatase n=1 Tax=Streptomyces kaniharaensis TaxID=212423 RepID=UPI002DDC9C87|nr:2-phosphosulfolactate phosphatase [Streptomyces kaniharaensis]